MYEWMPKTRREAVEKGLKYYFTGEPCAHGHVDKRKVNGGCYTCWTRTVSGRDKSTGLKLFYDEQGNPVGHTQNVFSSYNALKDAYTNLLNECEGLKRQVRDLTNDVDRYKHS